MSIDKFVFVGIRRDKILNWQDGFTRGTSCNVVPWKQQNAKYVSFYVYLNGFHCLKSDVVAFGGNPGATGGIDRYFRLRE